MNSFSTILLLIAVVAFLLNLVIHYRAGKLHRKTICIKDGKKQEIGLYPTKVLIYVAIALTLDLIGMPSCSCVALSQNVGMPDNSRALIAIVAGVVFAILPVIAWYIAYRQTKKFEPIDLTKNSPD